MNPHTPHPDESQDPSSSAAGTGPAATPPSGTSPTVPLEAPAGTSPTVPLEAPAGTSPTVPLEAPAGTGTRSGASGEPDSGTLPPPPYYGSGYFAPSYGAAPAAGSVPPHGARPLAFFDWVRSHGVHRGSDRWVGGVASGIAQRLGVDPLIVRGIFIVLAIFAGVGVLAYGIAWALLPEPDGRIHLQEAAAGRWSGGMTGALITTLIGLPGLGSGVWGWDRYGFGGFVWTVILLGAIAYLVYYLLRRSGTPDSAAPMSLSPATYPGDPGYPEASAGSADPLAPGRARTAAAGSSAAGYGSAAPGPAWAAPPPTGPTPPPAGYGAGGNRPGGTRPPAKPRNPGPGAPAVAVTAGGALLVGGGIKALDAANVINLGDAGNAVVWASGAAVLGLGILLVGLRGRTSGILGFFAAVALIIGGIFTVVPNGDRIRLQNAEWSPSSVEQAREGFEITGGRANVDLTGLALNAPLQTDVVVPIDATASTVTILLPATVPVQVQADMTMGALHEGGRSLGGITTRQTEYNTGQPGARLILKVSGTVSTVTIQEGN